MQMLITLIKEYEMKNLNKTMFVMIMTALGSMNIQALDENTATRTPEVHSSMVGTTAATYTPLIIPFTVYDNPN